MKECYLKIISEIAQKSDSKSFRITISLLLVIRQGKQNPNSCLGPLATVPPSSKRLHCQQLHTLGSNTHRPDTISRRLKSLSPLRRDRSKPKNHHHKHFTPLLLPPLSPMKSTLGNSSFTSRHGAGKSPKNLERKKRAWKHMHILPHSLGTDE